jgi:hypothetical protein
MTIAEGASALGISPRQMKRIRKRIGMDGAVGVLHGNEGRLPKDRIGKQVRARIVQLRPTGEGRSITVAEAKREKARRKRMG